MYNIDFSEPHWLIYSYHVVSAVSVSLNLFGIYLLVFQLKELGAFRYNLMLFQVICLMTDICHAVFSKLVPLYPINAVTTYGLLSDFFGVHSHYGYILSGFLYWIDAECLLWCFFRKHQTIAKIIDFHVVPKFMIYFSILLSILFPCVACLALEPEKKPREEQLEYINRTMPEYYESFASLPYFVIYEESFYVHSIIFLTLLQMLVLATFLIYFNLDLVGMLVRLKTQTSAVNYQRHREAIQSLVIQTFVSAICSIPPAILEFSLLIKMEKSQIISELCCLGFTFHSSINIISLLLFSPPYRRFLDKHIKRTRRQISVHALSQSG